MSRPPFAALILAFVAAAPPLHAQTPPPAAPSISAIFNFKKSTPEACGLLAVEAMAKEKFIRAEIAPDGNVYGFSEKAAVLVASTPFRDGVHFTVVAASYDNAEAMRLRDVVRNHVLESKSEPTAKLHQDEAADHKPCPLVLRWGSEPHAATPILRHFVPAACITVEKQGLQSHITPNVPMCIGAGADRLGLVFLQPGQNEVNVRIFSVGVGEETEADRLQRTIRKELIKVLFD